MSCPPSVTFIALSVHLFEIHSGSNGINGGTGDSLILLFRAKTNIPNIRSFRNEYSFEFTFNSSEYFSLFLEVFDPFEEVVKFSVIKLIIMS